MDYTNQDQIEGINEYGLIYEIGSLYDYFNRITDPRSKLGKQYALNTILVWMVLAKLGGQDKASGMAEWITHRKELWMEYRITNKSKTPSHMTYRRVLQQIISVEEFEQLLKGYHQQYLQRGQEVVFSMDGKTVRGTIPRGERRGTHLLAIYVPQQGLVLAQARVDLKENEITAAPHLLKQVSLEGAIVIADAMHTQKAMARQVVEGGGQYILTAKGNQSRTRWAIEKLFVHEVCNLQKGVSLSKDFQMAVKTEKGHGRIEKRTIMTSTLLNDYLAEWPYLAQVFRIEHITWYDQMSRFTREITYGITSLHPEKASPEKLLELIKAYWGIECGLHYRRDVTLQEDRTRLTVGDSGQNMAILNNLVLGLCFSSGLKNLASARRFLDAFPAKALSLLTSNKIPSL
jgi:predicted transposase YbfD/YdcC